MASTVNSTDGYSLLKTINLPGSVGGHGDYVAYDSDTNTIWLAQSPDHNVVVTNAATNAVQGVIPGVASGNVIAFTPQYAFVTDATGNVTDVYNKATLQKVGSVAQTGTTPDSAVYVPSTNQVFVASDDNNVEDAISATSPFTQAASFSLSTPSPDGPDVATYVPSKNLIYQPTSGMIDVINPATDSIVATWSVLATGDTKPMVYDAKTNDLIVGTTNKELLVLNADTGSIVSTISISGSVDQAAIDPAARLAFFGDKAGVVDVVNLDTDTLVGDLPAEANMHTLTVDPATHQVYVYENNGNKVDVWGPPATSAGTINATVIGGFADLTTFASQSASVSTTKGVASVQINNETINVGSANQLAFSDGTLDVGASSPGAEVIRLYQAALGRSPDQAGLDYWTAFLSSPAAVTTTAGGQVATEEVAQALLTSTEGQKDYSSTGLSGTGFVNQVYQNILHRAPESGVANQWAQFISNGAPAGSVVGAIANSTEAQADTASAIKSGVWIQNPYAAQVQSLYYTALDRAPDAAGLTAWTNLLGKGTSLQAVAQAIVGSPEFASVYGGASNTAFVTDLYQNVLGRTPDTSGLNSWVNNLTSGSESRADVVLAFSGSAERQAMHIGTQGISLTSTST